MYGMEKKIIKLALASVAIATLLFVGIEMSVAIGSPSSSYKTGLEKGNGASFNSIIPANCKIVGHYYHWIMCHDDLTGGISFSMSA